MIGNTTPKPKPDRTKNFELITYSYNVEVHINEIKELISAELYPPTSTWEITVTPPTRVPEPNTPEHTAVGDLHVTHPAFDPDTKIKLTSQLHKEGDNPKEYYTTYSVHIARGESVTIPLSQEQEFKTALQTALAEANNELNSQTRFTTTESLLHSLKTRYENLP